METMTRQVPHLNVTRKRRARCLATVLTVFGALAMSVRTPPANAQSGLRTDAVLTDRDAYLLLPSELISGPIVERTSLSPEGRNLVALRKSVRISSENVPSFANPNPPPPREEHELIFWNAGVHRPVSLWQSVLPDTHV